MPRRPSLPSVAQGLFLTPGRREIRLKEDWDSWQEYLNTAESFRYCPISSENAYTLRKEQGKHGKASYWYAYRKESGKLAKIYAGTSEGLTIENLEAIASQLTEKLQRIVTQSSPVTNAVVTQDLYVTNNEERERLQRENERLQSELQIALGKQTA